MALAITDACTGCYGCQTVCPTGAVRPRPPRFTILAASCTECAGKYEQPQCAAICPVEGRSSTASACHSIHRGH